MIRILVVDDHPAVRAGLDALLRREPGLVPVAIASGAAEAVSVARREHPDVALVDHSLGDDDGVVLTQALRASERGPRVVLYAAQVDSYLEVAGRLAGASAVVPKGSPARELFDIIRRVARGEAIRPREPARLLATTGVAFDEADRPILALVLDGTSPAEAADALGLDAAQFAQRTAGMLARLPDRSTREGVVTQRRPAYAR